MKQHTKICAVILAGVLLFAAAGLILFHLGYLPWLTKNIPGNASSFLAVSPSTESEEWFSDTVSDEDFDFGLDGNWIDLNDMEYATSDNLKSYLFIGTDHSGNESAKDESYQGSMADFLLVAILNKTQKTYGFIQLNRDTITEVMILDND